MFHIVQPRQNTHIVKKGRNILSKYIVSPYLFTCNSVETAQPGDQTTNPGIVMPERYASGQRVDSLARCVALRHHDARVGGSVPGLGSFNTVTLAPNNGSPCR